MAKIYFLYKEDNKELVPHLYISVDGNESMKINKNECKQIELDKGNHTILISMNNLKEIKKSQTSGGLEITTKEHCIINEEVNVDNDELYYIIHTPFLVSGKGKLEKVSKERLENVIERTKFWGSKVGVAIGIIIALIILFILPH